MITTTVFNLTTGQEVEYNLPPVDAVRNAYLQFDKRNGNTWTYKNIQVPLQYGKYSVACGSWCALLQ